MDKQQLIKEIGLCITEDGNTQHLHVSGESFKVDNLNILNLGAGLLIEREDGFRYCAKTEKIPGWVVSLKIELPGDWNLLSKDPNKSIPGIKGYTLKSVEMAVVGSSNMALYRKIHSPDNKDDIEDLGEWIDEIKPEDGYYLSEQVKGMTIGGQIASVI